jgi:hypothetical protein
MRSRKLVRLFASAIIAAIGVTVILAIQTAAQIEEPWNVVVVSETFSLARMTFLVALGSADKFETIPGWGQEQHSKEAFGELVASRGDCSIDLEVPEDALDAIAPAVLPLVVANDRLAELRGHEP